MTKKDDNTLMPLPAARRAQGAGMRAARLGAVLCAAGFLSACTVIPGTSAFNMRSESNVQLPVKDDAEGQVPANVKVTKITADLIIEQVRASETRFRTSAAGGRTATTQSSVPQLGLMHQDYRLGPGDIVNVTVWDHPELTIPAGSFRSAEQSGTLVAEDGTIFYPYVGTLKVSGMTVGEVRNLLANRLSRVIEKVQLDVRVISFRSKRIYVVGEVAKPGLQAIDDIRMTMLEAINRAGGVTAEADHGSVLLTRGGVTYRVDLQALYENGDTTQNIQLEPGDVVNVPDRSGNKIFVLGEVSKPGSFVMNKRRATLAEALSDAGFVNQTTSAPGWIYVMRTRDGNSELFHLNATTPDALLLAESFPLQPRDIVYVDVADIARWNRVISNILPTSTMLYNLGNTQYPLFGGRQP